MTAADDLHELRVVLEEIRAFLTRVGIPKAWYPGFGLFATMAGIDDEPPEEVLREIWIAQEKGRRRRDGGWTAVYVIGADGMVDRAVRNEFEALAERMVSILDPWAEPPAAMPRRFGGPDVGDGDAT